MSIHAITDYVSLLVGFELYMRLNQNPLPSGKKRYGYIIGGAVGALLGARLLALINDPALLTTGPLLTVLLTNKTIIGGIVGGIIGVEITKKILGIKNRTGDSAVLPLMMALIIGRIGCQLTGVSDGTIGAPCDLFWCFQQGDVYARHPLPLYEILFLLTLVPFAYRAYIQKTFKEGTLFRLFIIAYLGLRFFLEFLKENQTLFFHLTAIQWVCLAVCVLYLYDVSGELLSRVIRHGETDHELRDGSRSV